jgi:hypothetical protein
MDRMIATVAFVTLIVGQFFGVVFAGTLHRALGTSDGPQADRAGEPRGKHPWMLG